MSGPSLTTPEPALPTGSNPEGKRGLEAVLRLKDFRKLWLGQIFSQLADKFYIVLMVCLLYTSPSPRDATLSRMPSSA